jgi:cobalt-zinc-cadmium efflux system protein
MGQGGTDMSGNHSHGHSGHGHTHTTNEQRIGVAFILNFFFTILEVVGGFWTNSTAILADAVHDLGDTLALGSSWYLERKSQQKGDSRFTYGYRRFSLLGALISTVVLVIGSIYVLSEAVQRLIQPEHSHAQGMAALAVVGVLVNGVAVLRLRKGEGFNVRIVTWHLLEDVLGWVMVLIVSIVLMFADLHILDPLLSLLITLYILRNVLVNFKATMKVFLQGTPEDIDAGALEKEIRELDGIAGIHHAHLWTLDGTHHVFSAHIVMAADTHFERAVQIKQRVRDILSGKNIVHTTLETEWDNDECGMNGPGSVCS